MANEIDRLDHAQQGGIYAGSEPMRSTSPHDGTVTSYDRSVKNRDGSETFTVTKRGRTMQYTVGRNGKIVDGSVRYLSDNELSPTAAGAQEEYYTSNTEDPRWSVYNDPELLRRYGSREGIIQAQKELAPNSWQFRS